MNRRLTVVYAVVGVLIVALWWFMLYKPAGDDVDEKKDEVAQAERELQGLEAQLRRLEEIRDNGPAIDAELARLADLVPPTPDLAGFILGMNDLAIQSGIDWISVAPTEPAPGAGVATIQLGINIEGGFFQVLDYLNRLEDFERLVIIDGINIATGGGGGEDGGTAAPTDTLTISVNGRMFTTQVAGGTATTTTTTAPGATTTTTQAVQ